jgi:hypothetical protein
MDVPERSEYLALLDGLARQDCVRSVPQLNTFAANHKESQLADNALYWAGRCYALKGRQEEAISSSTKWDAHPKGIEPAAPRGRRATSSSWAARDARIVLGKLIRDYPSRGGAGAAEVGELEKWRARRARPRGAGSPDHAFFKASPVRYTTPMRVIRHLARQRDKLTRVVLTLGNFDGVTWAIRRSTRRGGAPATSGAGGGAHLRAAPMAVLAPEGAAHHPTLHDRLAAVVSSAWAWPSSAFTRVRRVEPGHSCGTSSAGTSSSATWWSF